MSKQKLLQIHQQVKENVLAKIRYQWFKEFKTSKNISLVCRKYGISRSVFYYWKARLALRSTNKFNKTSKALRLISYSRKPKTNPKEYPIETIKLILKIRKRTNRGAEYIWFVLRDRYAIYLSVTGIYKVLKRNNLIKTRRYKRKLNNSYEAPKYLPGDKIQIDVKYVKLKDELALKLKQQYRWVYQYTALDVATGIKCKYIYETHDSDASLNFLLKVKLFYPFPIKIIQTDNGFEFTWRLHPEILKIHPFTTQCRLFGFTHHLIPPAYPRANSHVERTHRIDEEEVYRNRTFTSLAFLRKVNLLSLKYFNNSRPQKSKHFLSPLKFAILKFRLQIQKLKYSVLNV